MVASLTSCTESFVGYTLESESSWVFSQHLDVPLLDDRTRGGDDLQKPRISRPRHGDLSLRVRDSERFCIENGAPISLASTAVEPHSRDPTTRA